MKRLTLFLALTLGASAALAAEVELTDCRISAGPGAPGIAARCNDFERPLDPANPDSGTITLRVAIVPALTLEPARDAFVPIAGGPGGSSINFYAASASAFEHVRRNRDILLVDQRGTGDSSELTCNIDDDLVEGAFTPEETLAATEQCLEQLPHDPRFFTTSIAVRDLDAIREALGYETLNLYGSSYGTRVAQHYARRFPDATRTVIIDGVAPPQVPLGPEIATESQRALDRVFERCDEDPGCSAQFPALREDFGSVRDRLRDAPVSIALHDPATGAAKTVAFAEDHMAVTIRLLLYNARTIALLPLVIHEAANDNFAPMAAQFQMAIESLADELSYGMHNSVVCTEDAPYIDFGSLDMNAIEDSYLGSAQLMAIETICSIWPRGPMDEDLLTPLATDKPVLLLSGDADPITPPRYAELAAVDLENAWLLTGVNQGHGLVAVGCMPRVIGRFIDTMQLGDDDADCLGDSFAMPFFLDFNGPQS